MNGSIGISQIGSSLACQSVTPANTVHAVGILSISTEDLERSEEMHRTAE
jgi:hypothetical protein